MTNREDYQRLLENHDWYYGYSDDHKAWRKGQAESDQLRQLAKSNPEFAQMYREYSQEKFS